MPQFFHLDSLFFVINHYQAKSCGLTISAEQNSGITINTD